MAVRQNFEDFALEFPAASRVVKESFYIADGFAGANSVQAAISLQHELQQMFACGRFTLHKWNCSNPDVLEQIPEELRES